MGCQLLKPLCPCRASAQAPARGAGVLRPRSEAASGSHTTGLPRAQVHQMRAHAVLGLSADPERPGQLTIQMLRTGQALVAPRPRLARRSAATDCADVAGPYSVRGPLQGRVGSCSPCTGLAGAGRWLVPVLWLGCPAVPRQHCVQRSGFLQSGPCPA